VSATCVPLPPIRSHRCNHSYTYKTPFGNEHDARVGADDVAGVDGIIDVGSVEGAVDADAAVDAVTFGGAFASVVEPAAAGATHLAAITHGAYIAATAAWNRI
jgi:hypothetical protein